MKAKARENLASDGGKVGGWIDFGKTARDYGKHRAGFPDAFFDQIFAMGIAKRSMRALDLGTGTGTLARGLALRGCVATGLDRSRELMDEAARLDRDAGVSVRYIESRAEATGLPDSSFELVTAGQCWHWFDRAAAAKEVRRLLVAGGHLVLAHFDWIPLPGNVVDVTEKLIERHNPAWKLGGGLGLHPQWLRDMGIAGFDGLETFSFDIAAPYTPEGWRGRIRASAGVGATLTPEQVAAFDAELKAILEARFPGEMIAVPHRVWAAIGRVP